MTELESEMMSVGSECQELAVEMNRFSDISSCHHLRTVLGSNGRDKVLSTYRQAVSVSQNLSEEYICTQKKDGEIVPVSQLLDLKARSLKCSECSLNNFNRNFICLQCPHVGCFGKLNHCYTHYKLLQHCFAIDSQNGLLYCFPCGDYVNDNSLEAIRLNVEKKLEPKDSKSFPDFEATEHYDNPSRAAMRGLKGFINLGSTCYMSCILQTLIHNPLVKYNFFNNDLHYFNCEQNHDYLSNGQINEKNACTTCSIDDIFKTFYTSSDSQGYGMTNLLTTTWYKKKAFTGAQEQDAHEFWQFLLNEFHLDHERVTGKFHSAENCTCITHSIFSGKLESSIRCISCNSLTTTVDPLVDLPLEVNHLSVPPEGLHLYDCLDNFTKEEKLDVKYLCVHCSKLSKASKSLKVSKMPPILSIQLKRFKHNLANDTFSKIEVPVKTPLFLNMTKYASQNSNPDKLDTIQSDKVYELFAVVSHIGSVNTGHYIVAIKNPNGRWLKFDDSVISWISQEEITTMKAYLLFYITHKI